MKHTPTPWKAKSNYWIRSIVTGESVAALTEQDKKTDKANAAFIVRACNAHEELLEVAKEAARYFDRYLSTNRVHPIRNKLVQAINKAEERR